MKSQIINAVEKVGGGKGLRLFLAAPLLLLAGLNNTGCANARSNVAETVVPAQVYQSSMRFRKEYVFSPGDQLELSVRRVPEVSRSVVVRPDGFISLPIINDVKVEGKTTSEVREELTKLLTERLLSPEVSVIPLQVRQASIYVLGDVNQPGAIPFREGATAMQALALAGGFKRSAAERSVAVIRLVPDGHVQAIAVDVQTKGQPAPYMALRGVLLQADDVLFIPENGRSQLARFLDDFVNRPLQGINSVVGTYVDFRLVDALNKQ